MTTFLVGLSGELAVKARATRRHFLHKLWKNFEEKAKRVNLSFSLEERGMRYILQGSWELASLLATHPGVSWYAPALVGNKDHLSWLSKIEELLPRHPFTYFVFMEKVENPEDMEISRKVKQDLMEILEEAKSRQDFSRYNHPVLHLEIRGEVRDRIYLYMEKKRGMGGLPTGAAPPTLTLLSGGPDSLLASLLMIRRGSGLQGIHFHYGHREKELVENQARVLAGYLPSLEFTLHWVEYQPLLESLKGKGPQRHLCLLCKALMFTIASRIAREGGLDALITGEILGEQASQTLPSLAFTSRSGGIPILRPLIAFNKEEVYARLKEWNLYTLATRTPGPCPYSPSHPVTRPRLKRDYGELLEELAAKARIEKKTYRGNPTLQFKDLPGPPPGP